jgi:hypothetical protein
VGAVSARARARPRRRPSTRSRASFKAGSLCDSAFATEQNNSATNTAFQLVELDYKNEKIIVANARRRPRSTIRSCETARTVTVSRDVGSATPAASELVNYANWFAYYRTRILAAKTVTSLAFLGADRQVPRRLPHAGQSRIVVPDDQGVHRRRTGHRKDWFAKLAAVSIPMGNDTPLIDGVVRIGEWSRRPTARAAALSGSTDPIALSCQKNFHMMFTDGYTNQAKPSSTMTNQDTGKIGKLPEFVVSMPETADWPKRYAENPASPVDDSLADYAMYYWRNDLRPAASFAKNLADNQRAGARHRSGHLAAPQLRGAVARHRRHDLVAQRRTRPRRPSRVVSVLWPTAPRRPIVRDPRAWTTCGMPRSTGTACS